MQNDNSERNEKIYALFDLLYPLILDRLKKDLPQQEKKSSLNLTKLYPEGVYFPELDYLFFMRRLLGELREARYHLGGGAKVHTEAPSGFVYAVHAQDGSVAAGNARSDLLIPSATVRRDLGVPYQIDWKQSYNNEGSQARYLRGVLDGSMNKNDERTILNSASAYTFNLVKPLTPAVINNTKDQWERMERVEPHLLQKRIVTPKTMEALLSAFEDGRAAPHQIAWEVHITASGESLEKQAERGGIAFDARKPNGGLEVSDNNMLLSSAMRNPLKIHANHQLGVESAFEADQWDE